MNQSLETEAETKYVIDTRSLLNFVYTDTVPLLVKLLGTPIYVPGQVHRELKDAESAIDDELKQLSLQRREPMTVQLFVRLQAARKRFQGKPFKLLKLDNKIRDLAIRLEQQNVWVDKGEAEVLALCISRQWSAILDDRQARNFALQQGIATVGTLELLINAVRSKFINLVGAESLLDEMRLNWPYAPRHTLDDYMSGRRSIW